MPTIAQLSQPMHRIAGVRINPRTNGPHRAQLSRAITLKSIADGAERKVTLPPNPMLSWIGFSPDGKRFAFTQQRDNGIELWIGDSATGQAKSITTAQLNATLGTPCEWVGDGGSMLCEFVSPSRGAAPTMGVPTGPNIQEHRGGTAPVRTYQDLLTSAHDEALFDYYATSQLAFVDAASGQRTPVGTPAVFVTAAPSPDGQFILVRRAKRPYSWLVPYQNFAASIEVWDRQGATVKQIAQLPVADNVPNGGVMPGPRNFQWQPLAPATVVWAEALDNGDPKIKVAHRDKVVAMSAPFTRGAVRDRPHRVSRRQRVVDRRRRGAADRKRSRTAVDAHLGDRPARRDAAQAVGPQPGRLLRQSRHAAAARRRLRRLDDPAERQLDLPRRHRRRAGRRAAVRRSARSHHAQERAPVPDHRPLVRDRDRRAVGRRLEDPDAPRDPHRSAERLRARSQGRHARGA